MNLKVVSALLIIVVTLKHFTDGLDRNSPTSYSTYTVCKEGTLPCNSEECYNPITESCVGSSFVPCEVGQLFCYKEFWSNEQMMLMGAYNLSKDLFKSRGSCYNISSHICISGHICKIGEHLCMYDNSSSIYNGNNECYHPKTHVCLPVKNPYFFNQLDFPQKLLCPVENKVCNGDCYNTTTHNCIDGHVCPIENSSWCQFGIIGCYNNRTQECIQTSFFDGIICNIGEGVCKHKCFNSSTHYCANDVLVCKIGEKLCNHICQNPIGNRCYKLHYVNNTKERTEFIW